MPKGGIGFQLNSRCESRAAEDGAEGPAGTTCFVELQPEDAAAPGTEARRAAN